MEGQTELHAGAVQLIKPNKQNRGFTLNSNIIKEIKDLDRMKKTKIAIICVAGAFRKGKSFLLNFFLRYLTTLVSGNTEDWIHSDDHHKSGFHWRSGSKRDTTGILLWSQPFFIRKPDGEEVAVLLMDTQGTFDHQTTHQDCTTIFAFSTLLSSVQIFNISQNIQETDLQHLQLFVEFAAMAKDSKDQKTLQHLWFLIRDWQYPDENAFGEKGGSQYLSTVLSCDEGKPSENQELRQGIMKHFQKASCFLMPHPGNAVTDSKFEGDVKRLESKFVDSMKEFIEAIVAPENITIKKVSGNELTGRELIDFLEIYFEAFSSGKMPTPKSVFAATVEMANISTASKAKELFQDKVNVFLDPEKSDAEFRDAVAQASKEAVDLFSSKCMERDSTEVRKAKKKLEKDLAELSSKATLQRQLRSEKLEAEKKTDLLSGEMDNLKQQTLDQHKQMDKMETFFKTTIEQIKSQSISKEEMERKLQEESMKEALVRKEMEVRNEEMNKQIAQLRGMGCGTGAMGFFPETKFMEFLEWKKQQELIEEHRKEIHRRERERSKSFCSIQ